MKFGIVAPITYATGEPNYVPQIINYLSPLEDKFYSVWLPDHLVPKTPPWWGGILECTTTIAYLSAIFTNFRFGSLVLCNSFRNPTLVAKIGATLQVLTNNRFILGIGAGWDEGEYIQYGYPFPSSAIRIGQLEEGIQLIKKMWTEDTVTFEGKYFKAKNVHSTPKLDSIPPIMIGGAGEKLTLKVVAKYADWWNLAWADPPTYERKLRILNRYCEQLGRDSDEIVKTLLSAVVIADTDEEAIRISKKPLGHMNLTLHSLAYFVGSPDTIINKIRAFADIGIDQLILAFLPMPESSSPILFAKTVIPEFS